MPAISDRAGTPPDLDWLPPEDKEGFGTLGQEPSKLVDQDMLDFVRLLDLDAYPHAVDARLDEHPLVLVASNGQRREEDFRGCPGLDLRDIVTLSALRGEVGEA